MRVFLTTTCFFFFTLVLAQDQKQYNKTLIARTLTTSPQSGFLTANSFVKLESNNSGTKATANIAYAVAGKTILSLNIEQPVSSTGKVQPLTLQGLSNNSSLTMGFQYIGQNSVSIADQPSSMAKSVLPTLEPGVKLKSTAQLQRLQLTKLKVPRKFYIGAKLGFVKQEFNYLVDTTTTFRKVEDAKTAVKLSFTIGFLWTRGTMAATLTHLDAYDAEDPNKFYFPVNGTGIQIEDEFSVGKPVHKKDQIFRLEYMSIGNSGKGKILRINPNINISFQHEIGSLEIPVFFLTHTGEDKKPNLNGGVYATYLTNEKFAFSFGKSNWGVGVFIGGSITDLFN